MIRTTFTRTLGCLVLSITLVLSGCGAEGEPAPEVDVPIRACQDLDERLATTLDAIEQGKAEQLATTLRAASEQRDGETLASALDSLLGLLSVLWIEIKDDPAAVDLDGLATVLGDLSGILSDVLRYLAQPGTTQAQSFDAISQIITECPSGSLTNAVALLLKRPQLLDALGDALADPSIGGLIESFPTNGSSDSQAGFAALIRTLIRAINNPNFVFQDLIDLINPFFDTTQPPLNGLISELQLLLTGDNLTTIRVLTQCLEDNVVLADGTSGSSAIGALLYGLIAEANLTQALGQLDPALALLSQPEVQSLLNALVDHLVENEAAREGLKPLLVFLLRPEHVHGAMADLAELIDAGLLSDLIGAVSDLFVGCETP